MVWTACRYKGDTSFLCLCSIDSDDDEYQQHSRELQTGSSEDEEETRHLPSDRAAMYITNPSTSSPDKTTIPQAVDPDKMDIDRDLRT